MSTDKIADVVMRACRQAARPRRSRDPGEVIGKVYESIVKSVSRNPGARGNELYVAAAAYRQARREYRRADAGRVRPFKMLEGE